MSLFNRSQLKHEFKTGTLSTEQKFSILIDSTYNRIEDSILMGPLGYVGTSGLIGPQGGTHIGLFIGSGTQGATGKVIILDEGIQVYNTDIQSWVTIGSTSALASNTLFSSSDIFTLRYGKEQGLLPGELTGIKFTNYNGSEDAGLYLNSSGDFLIQNDWGFNYAVYREESPIDNSFSYWSESDRKYLSGNIYSGASGNIGIGKTGPLYTLDISGDINFDGDLYQNGEKFVSSEWTKNLDGSLYYMGNVGIGVSDPIQKLEVGGNLRVTGSIYDSKNSPGVNGEVLVSTETGTDWKGLPEIYGVTGYGITNHIVRWTDQDTIEPSSIIDAGGTVSIGPSATTDLIVSGKIQSAGTIPTQGNEIDQVMSFTRFIRLTGDWQDVGINAGDLQTGTYVIQLYANDSWQGGSNYNEYYSGIMSWYSGDVINPMELPNDEIQLHRSGGGSDGGLYLRTYKYVSEEEPGYIKLQIYSNFENIQSSNYVFKFRRLF